MKRSPALLWSVLLPLLLALPARAQVCCALPDVEVIDPYGKLRVGSSNVYRVLASPSGRAHEDAFGAPFEVILEIEESEDCEEQYLGGWFLTFDPNTKLFASSGPYGTHEITCGTVGVPYVVGLAGTDANRVLFYPAASSTSGSIDLDIAIQVTNLECHNGDYRTVNFNGKFRTTDLNGDGDTDEGDESTITAALGQIGASLIADLDMNDTVQVRDLQLLRAEVLRMGGTGATMYSTTSCDTYTSYDPANYVRYEPPRILDLSATDLGGYTIRLSWTAPNEGSDSPSSPATAYDIRHSSVPITNLATFLAGTVITGAPTPGTPGNTQTLDLPYVHGYYAMRAKDDCGNWSAVSDSVIVADIAPKHTTTLGAVPGREQIKLAWMAPGEDGPYGGPATAYDLRMCQCDTASFSWGSAESIGGPTPSEPGEWECLVVTGLPDGTQYSFAVMAQDAAGNWSLISNKRQATTKTTGSLTFECGGGFLLSPQDDRVAPAAPQVLALSPFVPNPSRTGGAASLSLPGELQHARVEAGVYDLFGRLVSALETGSLEGGSTRRIAWDLRDATGHRVQPGLYYLRARVDSRELTRSVIVSP